MSEAKTPWHRVPFVWLVITLPLTAVVAGFTMLWLAIATDDGLVADDYYKRGKEINRVLARDRAAVGLGLKATLTMDAGSHRLTLQLDLRDDTKPPELVELHFLHTTRAGLDKILILPRKSGALYEAPLPELSPGRWHLQLSAQNWRLTGSLRMPAESHAELIPALSGS